MPLTPNQAAAVAARGNVIVVAGAGTGKTSTLVERCLQLLHHERASLDRVLMVTFTEAAAAEMRHRLRARLQELAVTSTEISGRERFEEQLALVESARISTLHSFCLDLVRSHFHELGVDPQPNVLDEHQCRVLAETTLDELLQECYAGSLPWQQAVRALVAAYAADRDGLVREWVLQLHRYTQSLPDARGWLEPQVAAWGSAPDDPGEDATETEARTRTLNPLVRPPGLSPESSRQTEHEYEGRGRRDGVGNRSWEAWLTEAFAGWRQCWLPVIQAHAGVKNIDDCLEAMVPAAGEVTRERVSQTASVVAAARDASWPRGTAGSVRDPLKPFFDEARFLASVAAPGALEGDWQAVRGPMEALLALTAEFTSRFSRAKRDLGGVDFPDLEQLALQLLRDDQGEPTAVAESVRTQFDYVFVDEYQDINAAQDALLLAVSRTGAEANRFLVGDVKQSIYQFRLADPQIFRAYERDWGDGAGPPQVEPTLPRAARPQPGQRIPLTDNFRSRPAILDFVNRLFSGLMRESLGGVSYEPLLAGSDGPLAGLSEGPCVELHLIRKESDVESVAPDEGETDSESLSALEREARLVATRLRELKESGFLIWDRARQHQRAVEWGDMAVLLRSPGPRTEAFAKEFHRAGIPLAAERGGFLEAMEVSDLLNLLRLLDNPLQDIPLLAVLRSPLVGLSLDELAAIRVHSGLKPLWSALRSFARSPAAGPAGNAVPPGVGQELLAPGDQPGWAPTDALRTRAASFLRQFERWRELARQVGPSLCLEQVLTDTDYDVLLSLNDRGSEQLANVNLLLDYARQFDPYQRQGLFRFLRFIESLETAEESLAPAPVTARDAVRLMSVHRSKGLEFPVVALAALGAHFNLQELNSVLLLDPHYGLAPKALTPSGTGRYPTLPFWLAERRQRAQRLGEELRLLYVATTRARDRLILTGWLSGKHQDLRVSGSTDRLSDQELIAARSPMDWLGAWFPSATRASDWEDDHCGATAFMTWQCWSPKDPRLKPSVENPDGPRAESPAPTVDGTSVEAVVQRLSWQYAHPSATTEPAKSSVSVLRRRALDLADEESIRRFASPRRPGSRSFPSGGSSAAERGTLHHRFLQHLQIKHAGNRRELAQQLKDFVSRGLFSQPEADRLDLEAIASFWASDVGGEIRAADARVRRELPFTVRLADGEVRSILGQEPDLSMEGEFVVVQGVVDLAVVLDDQIWLLDFKTDQVFEADLITRAKEYAPQLRLYAAALERIYCRPASRRWLHFLTPVKTVEVS